MGLFQDIFPQHKRRVRKPKLPRLHLLCVGFKSHSLLVDFFWLFSISWENHVHPKEIHLLVACEDNQHSRISKHQSAILWNPFKKRVTYAEAAKIISWSRQSVPTARTTAIIAVHRATPSTARRLLSIVESTTTGMRRTIEETSVTNARSSIRILLSSYRCSHPPLASWILLPPTIGYNSQWIGLSLWRVACTLAKNLQDRLSMSLYAPVLELSLRSSATSSFGDSSRKRRTNWFFSPNTSTAQRRNSGTESGLGLPSSERRDCWSKASSTVIQC